MEAKKALFGLRLDALCLVIGLALPQCNRAHAAARSPAKIASVRVEGLHNPLGVDDPAPRFSWIIASSARGLTQTAYRIRVASSEGQLRRDEADVWDSGKQDSDAHAQVPFAGPPLQSRSRYYVRVDAWDDKGRSVGAHPRAFFETGLLRPTDWTAEWIGLEPSAANEGRPTLLRKPFAVEGRVQSARLYVTAAGIYEMRMNGQKVGRDVLTPGWTAYHKRIRYQSYDVTGLLQRGDNVLAAIVAPGWFSGRNGLGRQVWGREQALLAQMHLRFADGSARVVGTDGSWLAQTGPWTRADMFDGEAFDARRYVDAWDRPSAPAARLAGWQRAVVLTPAVGRLEAQIEPAVRVVAQRPAVASSSPAAGVQIFDLGQNIVGWIRLRGRFREGTKVRLRHGEMLNKDGTLFTDNLRTAQAMDEFTARGGREETFEPRFTYHGFRYVEISGHGAALPKRAVTGMVVASDLPVTGRFESAHRGLAQLQSNIVWSQRGNFLSIPTDCPQRDERVGWTADIRVFARTATFNMDIANFLSKYVIDIFDGQKSTGSLPDFAPTKDLPPGGSFGWGDAGVILPWLLYDVYGDRRVLERHHDGMKRWVDFRVGQGPTLLNGNSSYGDWVSPDPQAPKHVLGPMYDAQAAEVVAMSAAALGRTQEAKVYRALAERIRAAWQKAYLLPSGRIESDTQSAYALAFRHNMLPYDMQAAAAENFAAAIERANGHLATGFLGTSNLLPGLTRANRDDLAYAVLLKQSFPGWLYTVSNGATTMWERWNSYSPQNGPTNVGNMNSYNHYAFGAVGEWMYARAAGLDKDPDVPAYRKVWIRPALSPEFTGARATYDSSSGRIVSGWRRTRGGLTMEVEIPVHATARVWVPDAKVDDVWEGGRPAASAPGIRAEGQEEGAAVFDLGSGRYRFSVMHKAPPRTSLDKHGRAVHRSRRGTRCLHRAAAFGAPACLSAAGGSGCGTAFFTAGMDCR